jgi:single stranded DNA-binding protein
MSNSTTICGNLTREPEIRYTKEGQATAQLGVAVNRRWQDRTTNEWQEATSFFDVICWRDLAENVALSLTKGMRVVVTGRLEHRSWETDEGEHRSKVFSELRGTDHTLALLVSSNVGAQVVNEAVVSECFRPLGLAR